MTADTIRLSVVCPAFDEQAVLPHFHAELCRVLESLGEDYDCEIVYVDDGSTDDTLRLLRSWARSDGRVRYVSLSRNFGHQAAFAAGLEHALGDVVVTLDCDLQHPPNLIPELLARWRRGHDVVLTERTGRGRGRSRWFGRLLARWSQPPLLPDTSDYCLLSRRAVDGLRRLRETHRYQRGLIQWLGFPTAVVAFTPAPRRAGVSKFTPRRLCGYGVDAVLSFSRAPLRLLLLLGLCFVLCGLGCAGYAVVAALSGAALDPLLTLLLVSVHLSAGCVLGGLALVGEYVGRVFEQTKGRPLYLLKETEVSLSHSGYDLPDDSLVPDPGLAGGSMN